ncbi:MAG: phenylalanine--tRNA ligase subunit beta [Thermoanaerobaculales bacterium]|jgi:phenylalanyl-tRNA synthetase beta chain|nr:phenylalanine--tRNA ligase subunit beta [Thermoanaerobaculales bacterium]
MKFDAAWLLDLLHGAPGAEEVADRLTACGFLVELREPGIGGEVWEVEVTTNRPDAMNHRGLAREAAAATGSTLAGLSIDLAEDGPATADLATVEIADPTMCRRFCARVIRGARRAASPEWMQRRLVNAGVRPISAIVDVTNYVLLELGQPLHAYDLAKVRGATLVARRAVDGEVLVTLDGERRTLGAGMPVIADGERAVGLGGIMGGADTEIGEDTTDILLEAASFDPLTVRRAARRLGMHTEASHRFERGADPGLPPVAIDYAAALIAGIAGGTVCRGRIDVCPSPVERRRLRTSAARVSAFIGLETPAERLCEIAQALELEPEGDGGDAIVVTVPSFRVDLEREADLVEEFVRHLGFEAIPARLPVLSTAPGRRNPNWELVDRARAAAVSAGLAEIVTWSFIDPSLDAELAAMPLCPGAPVELDNPLAATQSTMRRSLLPGVLGAVRDNLNQGERAVAVFEQGRVFWQAGSGPAESERLAVALVGPLPGRAGQDLDFAELKGVVELLTDVLGFPELDWKRGGAPWLDEAEGAVLETAAGRIVGLAGRLAGPVADRFDLRPVTYVAELDLGGAAREVPLPSFVELPRQPAVTADMTVEHATELSYAELATVVRDLASELVEDIGLLVRFAGEGLPPGTVRTTLRLTYRAADRSLTQLEVNELQDGLRQGLTRRLDVRFA